MKGCWSDWSIGHEQGQRRKMTSCCTWQGLGLMEMCFEKSLKGMEEQTFLKICLAKKKKLD